MSDAERLSLPVALPIDKMVEREIARFPRAAGRAVGGLDLRCVIFARQSDRLVLIRHRRHPVYGSAWTLPGGTLGYGQNPRDSAARILRDQIGVLPDTMRLLGVESSTEGDWILTFHFESRVTSHPLPGGRIAEARLVPMDGIPTIELHPAARLELEKYRIHELAKTR